MIDMNNYEIQVGHLVVIHGKSNCWCPHSLNAGIVRQLDVGSVYRKDGHVLVEFGPDSRYCYLPSDLIVVRK